MNKTQPKEEQTREGSPMNIYVRLNNVYVCVRVYAHTHTHTHTHMHVTEIASISAPTLFKIKQMYMSPACNIYVYMYIINYKYNMALEEGCGVCVVLLSLVT